MSSPQAGATSDNVVHDNGSFDPELARAYTLMASQEFKTQWYLESTRNEDSSHDSWSEEDDTRYMAWYCSQSPSPYVLPTSSEDDDNTMVNGFGPSSAAEDCISLDSSSDTMMISKPKSTQQDAPLASSSSPKKNPPVRQLRPRRQEQKKPYTYERARYTAQVRKHQWEELLSDDTRSRRDGIIEDQYEDEEEHAQQYDVDDDDDDDPMDTQDDDDDDSEEPIVRKGLQDMRLSKKRSSSPSRSTSSPSLPSTPTPIDLSRSSGHMSLWPSTTATTRAPTVSRVYGSKNKKKHRMSRPMKSKQHSSRRRAPRIIEDDDNDDDTQQLQSEDEEDIFAFPRHPIDSPLPNAAASQSFDDNADDIFDFPIDDIPIDDDLHDDSPPTAPPRSTHQTAMEELKRRRQGRQRTTTNDDEFVVEDSEEFKPKKRKRFNMNELPSTHGVLPRSFGIVAKRMEERPKPIAQMELLDDEDDHNSLSSSSEADESPGPSNEFKQPLLSEFIQRSHPSSSSRQQQPVNSSTQSQHYDIKQSPSNNNRSSSSRIPRSSNSKVQLTSGSSNNRQTQYKKRRRKRNNMDGIYIIPRPDDPDYLPYLPNFGRGDRSRSYIPFLSSDDEMELDTNINSRPNEQPASTTFNSTSNTTHQPFQHSLPSSPPLPPPPSPPPPIQDPFVQFLESHPSFAYDFNTTPSQYTGSLSSTLYIGRGFLANLFEQEQPIAMAATQVFGEELPMMDMTDDTMAPALMDYVSLQRLLFKCFHHLANHIERDREQDIELRKFTYIYHFLSWSIMVQGRSLPGYFEKEIECLVQRVLTLNGNSTPSKWVILTLVYYMDWKRRLHPSLNDSRAQNILLENLYRLGPDQVHIQVNETNLIVVNTLAVEAWITLLKFEADHGQLWHTLWKWIEQDEKLAEWDKVERAWHWLYVIRVMRGFDTRGQLSAPPLHDPYTWPGVPQLVASSRQLVEKCGPKHDQYVHCLRKRLKSLRS
ncbi:hypothetical protein K492DRAFT_207967 [Lichtheimia hyalospora FSU 10163]|nr:hypothetical protein K492DRAFT_207967 [Lichtheimia hyalospora FSU 10163]